MKVLEIAFKARGRRAQWRAGEAASLPSTKPWIPPPYLVNEMGVHSSDVSRVQGHPWLDRKFEASLSYGTAHPVGKNSCSPQCELWPVFHWSNPVTCLREMARLGAQRLLVILWSQEPRWCDFLSDTELLSVNLEVKLNPELRNNNNNNTNVKNLLWSVRWGSGKI